MKNNKSKGLLLAGLTLLIISPVYSIQAGTSSEPPLTQQKLHTSIIAEGQEGSVHWSITPDGSLMLQKGRIKQYSDKKKPEWSKYSRAIKKVILTGTLKFDKMLFNGNNAHLAFSKLFAENYEGLENIDFSKVSKAKGMFESNTHLTSLDLSPFNTKNLEQMSDMFANTPSLEILNLSNFDTRKVTKATNAFKGTTNLKSLILGHHFAFKKDMGLPNVPKNSNYTGYWRDLGPDGTSEHPKGKHIFTSEALMSNYDGKSMAGTFVWLPNTLYGGEDLSGTTTAPHKCDAAVQVKTTLEDPFGEPIAVTAKITDQTGNEVQNGKLGAGEYTITYTGVNTKSQPVTVAYALSINSPDISPVTSGSVTVHYQDEEGNPISPNTTLTGDINNWINPKQKVISGYRYQAIACQGNTYKFTNYPQNITLIYAKNQK
ncbi:BspA family leucine-rich repeat surface protein [Lactococcus garvieae]|uniref:BspA family leucine-rich repeat surface protein n=1 Tax=Lactococcus garvieae TaxID=1363 RepID=UPI003853FAB3